MLPRHVLVAVLEDQYRRLEDLDGEFLHGFQYGCVGILLGRRALDLGRHGPAVLAGLGVVHVGLLPRRKTSVDLVDERRADQLEQYEPRAGIQNLLRSGPIVPAGVLALFGHLHRAHLLDRIVDAVRHVEVDPGVEADFGGGGSVLGLRDREIALITGCLEMVHRASSAIVAMAWSSIGYETLPLLVKVLERPVGRIDRAVCLAKRHDHHPGAIERAVRAAVSRDLRMSVQRVTKLCAIYSLVPQAKVAMAECPGLLAALVRIIDTQKNKVDELYEKPPRASRGYQKQDQARPSDPAVDAKSNPADDGLGLHMTEASRFNAIATLTNLAAAEPNRMAMLAEPNLIDSVARIVHNGPKSPGSARPWPL